MGLGTLVDKEKGGTDGSGGGSSSNSSSSSGSRNKELSKQELEEKFYKVIGSTPYQKVFTEEQWEEVSAVIEEHFEMSVGEVCSLPEEERHRKLHEAAMWSEDEEEEEDPRDADVCYATGTKLAGEPVIIGGEAFAASATAGQVAAALSNRNGFENPYT